MDNRYVSQLKDAALRTLSAWLHYALAHELIRHADLIRHFGVKELITKLSPEIRGQVFCACHGGGDPVRAAKVDAQSIAIMVSAMLKDRLIDESLICQAISTDHLVEVLPAAGIYRLVDGDEREGHPWLTGGTEENRKRFMAAAHAVIHEQAVLSPDDYVRLLESKLVHEQTPTELLVIGQLEATKLHREGKTFSGADFIKVYAPEQITTYVKLEDLFGALWAVATNNHWTATTTEAEPKSESGIPADALDSIPPVATKPVDDEPEISITDPKSGPPTASADDDHQLLELDVEDDIPPTETAKAQKKAKKHAPAT